MQFRSTLAAASTAIIFYSSPSYASSASSLLAAYSDWRGGSAFARFVSLRETGSFADGGLSGPARLDVSASGATEQALRFGSFSFSLTTAGGGTYTNLSGQVLPLSSVELGFARADAAALFPIDGTVTVAPDETVAGRAYAVLRRRGAAGAMYDYLLSASSGALYAVRAHRNGSTEITTYTDWRVVDGVRLPFHVHAEGDAGLGPINEDTTDFTVDRVMLNDAFSPGPLRGNDVPAFPPGQVSSGWIPFQFRSNEIFLPVRLNSHPVEAILDSGAGVSVVDSAAAARFGVQGLGRFNTAGLGGLAAVSYAPGTSLDVGTMRLPGVTAGVIDLGLAGAGMSPPLVVILGAEAFNQAVVDIDYVRRRLRFSRASGSPPPSNARVLPLGTLLGAFTVPVSVEGADPIPVMLDTGDDGTFQLYSAYWHEHDLLEGRRSTIARSRGVGGSVAVRLTSLRSLGIDGIMLHDLSTAFEPLGIDSINQTAMLGIMGEGLISRFHVVIDVPDHWISFIPEPNSVKAPFRHDLVGLETLPSRNGRKVFFVMPGSPAEKAGMVAGDELVAINGKHVGPDSGELIDNARPGDVLVFKLTGQADRIVTAARFY